MIGTVSTGFGETYRIFRNHRHVWILDSDGVSVDPKYIPAILAEFERQTS